MFLDGIEIGHRPIGFSQTVTFLRGPYQVGYEDAREIGRSVGFSSQVSVYRRNLFSFQAGRQISHHVEQAGNFIRIPISPRIFEETRLVDIRTLPVLPGDTGREIVFNIPGKLRGRPVLIAPLSGTAHRLGQPVMAWIGIFEAEYYEVQVARDIDFQDRVARLDVWDVVAQGGFPFGGSYYWRVRGVGGQKVSDFSQVWRFDVSPLFPEMERDHKGEGLGRLLSQFREG